MPLHLCVFLELFLLFILFYSELLVLSYCYYYSLDACLFSIRDGKGVDLVGGVEGGIGRTTSRENHNQNLLSEKSLFTIKMGGSW